MTAERDILRQIIEVDDVIIGLMAVLDEYPARSAAVAAKRDAARQAVTAAHEAFLALKKDLNAGEHRIQEKEALVKKLDTQLNAIKRNDEFAAVRKQIADVKGEISNLEEALIPQFEKADALQAAWKAEQARCAETEKALDADQAALDESKAYAEDRLAVHGREKSALLDSLDMDLATRYRRLFDRYKDQVIVLIENGVCRGCGQRATPQILNQVLGGALCFCPQCGRVLLQRSQG